jgi:hypothetical protein
MLTLIVEDKPHRAFAHFRGKLVRRLAHDAPSYSGVGASGKPGVVQVHGTLLSVEGCASGQSVLAFCSIATDRWDRRQDGQNLAISRSAAEVCPMRHIGTVPSVSGMVARMVAAKSRARFSLLNQCLILKVAETKSV